MRRIVRYGVVAVVAVVVLSACGAGQGSDAMPVLTGVRAQRLIAASADKATEVGTARMRGEVTVTVAGQTKTITMDGAVDFRSGAMQFGMDLGALGLPADGEMKIEMLVVDGVSYLRFVSLPDEAHDLFEARMGGRSWIRFDPAAFGLETPGATGFDDSSPGSSVGALRGVDDVVRVGTEDVRGEPTTHYRGRIDVAKAMASLPEELRSNLDSLGGLFDGDWPVEVWVDADGQTRKMVVRIASPMMVMEQEFEFYDFGTDVDLSAPPADDVVDFQQVFGPLGAATPPV